MTAAAEPLKTALSDQGQSSARRVATWALWDWGTQPFNTVITTFVFSVYLTSSAFGDTNTTSIAMSTAVAVSGVLIALMAPVLGQHADRSGTTVRDLRVLTWVLGVLSAALYLVRPEPGYLWLGLALLGVGSIVSEIASVNYNATIEQVATPKNVGRVSGIGWGMGYLGGIVVLLLLYFGFIKPEVGLFGVTSTDAVDIRVSMIVCGVWTLLFTIPPLVMLRDRPVERRPGLGVVGSYKALLATIGDLWRRDRPLVYFLLASALFRDGLAGVFAYGGILAAGTFGFTAGGVIVFGAVANVTAGVSTMLFGLLDDRLGPRRVILISLAFLVALGIVIFVLHDGGAPVFWVAGLGMTLFVGPAQSASRSYLARLIPEGNTGEVFGLYATTGRAISFLSPVLFGAALLVGARITGEENTQYWGILGIVLILAAGFALMLVTGRGRTEETAPTER